MKKVGSKKAHTEDTVETLSNDKDHVGGRLQQQNLGMENLNLNSVDTNVTTGLDSANERKIAKHVRRQESRGSDPHHLRLTSYVREMFLEIRQRTIEESPNCVLFLKKTVPFEESDDTFIGADPLQLLKFIKEIFDKTLELKNEAERELALQSEKECGDYETSLQKLEAEVRNHIRIEQQLKLYVESVQSKLDEHEKETDLEKANDIQKEVENLQQENLDLSEKVKMSEKQIQELKKKLNSKIEMIERLEKQIENIPILKRMIREMDRVLEGGKANPSKSASDNNTLKVSQRSADTSHSSLSFHDMRARKSSHPLVSSYNHEHDRNRDSGEYIKVMDASAHYNEGPIRQKDLNVRDSKVLKESGHKYDGSSTKLSARNSEKNEDIDSSEHKKPRRSTKGDISRSHDKERNTEQDRHSIDNLRDIKALLNAKIKEDIIEPSKFGNEAAFKIGMEEFLKKSFDHKTDQNKQKRGRSDSSSVKKTKAQVIESLRDKAENLKMFSHKNSLPKNSRPGTAGEKFSPYQDSVQHSADHNVSELYKIKDHKVRKGLNDRSQSVDPKKKQLKKNKSKGSIHDDDTDEHHKKHTSFIASHKAGGSSKVNQSGSNLLTRSHN